MKTRKRYLVLSLALLMLLTPLTMAAAADTEPSMQTFSKTVQNAKQIEFTKADFDSRVPEGHVLTGIVITVLPDAALGTLQFGARVLMTGEAVPADGLNMLRFVPAVNGSVRTSFEFLPVWESGITLDSVAVSINLLGQENRSPVAENQELATYKNIALTSAFKASDPDNDPLSYKIISKPKRGEIELRGDGSFVYTPYQNKTGKDSFKYVATDSFGNISAEAEVIIKIDKPNTKLTYSDMEGNAAHYAALRMTEANVFTGERMGDSYYFNPDREVTRGEFIAMALGAVGMTDLAPVSQTGFADDADTPAWVKPYAQAALRAGIISGVSTNDGRKLLSANSVISKAEAAVILNNAIRLADSGLQPVFADEAAIPVWAYQAAVNLESVGVLQPDREGALGLDSAVTRADSVIMLNAALEVEERRTQKTGLLSWAFK